MSLVTYSDSDSSGPPTPPRQPAAEPAALPPLPSSFHNLYATEARASTSDDPALHGGRKRGTPHVQGSWPSHVYVEWIPSAQDLRALEAIVHRRRRGGEVRSLLRSELGAPLPLHVSLSQTLSLATDQRDAFADRLRRGLRHAGVARFGVRVGEPAWASNFSDTRHFLVLPVADGDAARFGLLLDACNAAADAFGLPRLYGQDSGARFHVSIAWSLKAQGGTDSGGPPGSLLGTGMDQTQLEEDGRDLQGVGFNVASIKAKIGNAILEFDLNE